MEYLYEQGLVLNKPKGYRGEFSWEKYLDETRSKAVPAWAFKPSKHDQTGFKKGTTMMASLLIFKKNPIF